MGRARHTPQGVVIGESTQQALIGDDFSVTTAFTLILTLVGLDIVMSFLKQKNPRLDRIMEGVPLIIVQDGKAIRDRMDKARVDEADVLEAVGTVGRDGATVEACQAIIVVDAPAPAGGAVGGHSAILQQRVAGGRATGAIAETYSIRVQTTTTIGRGIRGESAVIND